MTDDEIMAIAFDAASPYEARHEGKGAHRLPSAQNFVHAFTMIVDLKLAKWLHEKNIEEGGPGIAPDFECFVDETIENIRSRRLYFMELSEEDMRNGIGGFYYYIFNYFKLATIEQLYKNGDIFALNINIHEATHSYNDAHGISVDAHDEMRAYNNGKKTEILYELYWPGYGREEKAQETLIKVQNRLYGDRKNTQARQLKCLGFGGRFVNFVRYKGEDESLYENAYEGYKRELNGLIVPAAHHAMAQRSIISKIINHVRGRTIATFPHGEKRPAVEAMLRGACSEFHLQRSRLADRHYLKVKKLGEALSLLDSWAAIHGMVLYLEPQALPRLGRIMETRNLPFIEGLFWKLPYGCEGI